MEAGGRSAVVATVEAEGTSAVVTAIQEAVTSVGGDAAVIIAAAVGLGITFWGAKVLWSKFKSMAK